MLELQNVSIKIGGFNLSSVNLKVEKGEYFVLAGPSGAGKTILLETIAGINKPNSGRIFLENKDISHLRPGKRGIGMVFQDNTSFPHLSVKNNIRFALKLQKPQLQNIEVQLAELAERLGIKHLLDRMPATLSGGELQRVILARTLASGPKVLMLDEPLSSIDTTGKDQLKSLLRNLNRNGQTIIHVTHDFDEAVSLASKVGIMNAGKIIEQGSAELVFFSPKNEFTARFCGYKNYFRTQAIDVHHVIIADKYKLRLNENLAESKKIALLIPEESIIISRFPIENESDNTFQTTISDVVRSRSGFSIEADFGKKIYIHVDTDTFHNQPFCANTKAWVYLNPEHIKIIPLDC